jgi:hypothetical protein
MPGRLPRPGQGFPSCPHRAARGFTKAFGPHGARGGDPQPGAGRVPARPPPLAAGTVGGWCGPASPDRLRQVHTGILSVETCSVRRCAPGAGRAAPLRGAGPAGGRSAVRQAADIHRRGQGLPPAARPGFAAVLHRVSAYLEAERPATAATDAVFTVLKGRCRGRPLTAAGLDEILDSAGAGPGLLTRPATSCGTRA